MDVSGRKRVAKTAGQYDSFQISDHHSYKTYLMRLLCLNQ